MSGFPFTSTITAMSTGSQYAFHGAYREIVCPECIVQTSVFEPFPDAESRETAVFEERDGRTIATSNVVHQTVGARDAHIAAGTEGGVIERYERLDGLLAAHGGRYQFRSSAVGP